MAADDARSRLSELSLNAFAIEHNNLERNQRPLCDGSHSRHTAQCWTWTQMRSCQTITLEVQLAATDTLMDSVKFDYRKPNRFDTSDR